MQLHSRDTARGRRLREEPSVTCFKFSELGGGWMWQLGGRSGGMLCWALGLPGR